MLSGLLDSVRLGLLDCIILVAYLVIVAAIGFYVARREKKTTEDYFLAGFNVPWYAIGLSMVASSISTEQFIGEVGYAYTYGLAVANWEWLNFVALSVLIWIFIPFYIRGKVTTMPEFLERRYGPAPRAIFAWLTVISYMVVNLPLVLYGGGLALNYIFGTPIFTAAVLLAVLTGAYTIYGGLASVVWTDVFQCVLLLIGGLLIFFLGLYHVGWDAIRDTGDRAHLILPASHPELPWTAILAIAVSTNIWYFCTNQYINQRCLAARDEWHAKMGIIFCGFLGVLLGLSVAIPGLIAHAIDPHLKDPNQAYPFLVTTLLPPALRGIILAALVSAIMSTISALVNSTATVFTIDIFHQLYPREISQARLITVGRWCGVVTLTVGTLCVHVVGEWEHIFKYCQDIWVLLAGPTVAVFVVGVFWPRATSTAAIVTLSTAFPLMALVYLEKAYEFLPAPISNLFVLGLYVLPASIVLMIIVSLLTAPPPAEKAYGLLWRPSMLRLPATVMKRPWYKGIVLWWALFIGMFIAIYAWLW
jgi:SSS family solute:Na+ symporter